jgi:hypothetical protein
MIRWFGDSPSSHWVGLAAVVVLVGAGLAGHAAAAPARQTDPVPVTVFFLMDDSNCMAGNTLNGMDAEIAIQKGAEALMDQLDMQRDRAAVVLFGDTATLAQGPTHDRQAVSDGVAALTMRGDSARLDLGYLEVGKAIAADTAAGEKRYATVVITDGPMMQAPELAKARAASLQRQGVRHYAIAIGTIAQYGLLRQIAEPEGFFDLPFGGDVISPYQYIGKILAGVPLEPWVTATPGATQTPRPEPGTRLPPPGPQRRVFLPLSSR